MFVLSRLFLIVSILWLKGTKILGCQGVISCYRCRRQIEKDDKCKNKEECTDGLGINARCYKFIYPDGPIDKGCDYYGGEEKVLSKKLCWLRNAII